jgi:hypothetical protein
MKLWGKTTLPNEFTWTPAQLLTMIKEVDKICPEEGIQSSQPTEENGTNPE